MTKNLIIYLFGALVSGLIPILSLMVYVEYLSKEDIANLSLFMSIVSISASLLGLGLHGYCARAYHADNELQDAISSTFAILFISAFFCALLTWLSYKLGVWQRLSLSDYLAYELVYAAIVISFSRFVTLLLLGQLQASKQALRFINYKISLLLIEHILSLLLIIYIAQTFEMRVYGILIVFAVGSARAIIYFKSKNLLSLNASFKGLAGSVNYGLRLLPYSFLGVFMSQSDRLFLSNLLTKAELADYYVAATYALLLGTFAETVNRAISPFVFDRLNAGNSIILLSAGYVLSVFLAAIFLILIGPWFLPYAFPDSYRFNVTILNCLILLQLVRGLNFHGTSILIYYRMPAIQSVSASAGFIILIFCIAIWGTTELNVITGFICAVSVQLLITTFFSLRFLQLGR